MSNWRFALITFLVVDVAFSFALEAYDSAHALVLVLGQLAFGAGPALVAAALLTLLRARRKTNR